MTQVKLEDSNMANYGSDEHIALRLEAAKSAEEWKGAGAKPGVEIWRIEQFNVRPWPQQRYGEFYNGDSYIVLHTYEKQSKEGSKALAYDAHFWIGTKSSQDEYTVAAYKTVELDDLFGDAPVQHREVEGAESDLFLSYFANEHPFRILQGGIDTGFKKGEKEAFKPVLYHLKGKKVIRCIQVPLATSSLNHGDTFVLDIGTKVLIWEPAGSSRVEKFAASRLSSELRSSRGQCDEVYVGEEGNDEFWQHVQGPKDAIAASAGDDLTVSDKFQNRLFRLSDESGKLQFTKIAEGTLSIGQLSSADVFVIDLGKHVFVYVGKDASAEERKNAMRFANAYLLKESRPVETPVTRVLEGQSLPKELAAALH